MTTAKTHNELAAEWVAPDTLVPWARNPRNHAPAEIEKIAKSLDRFGFGAPIVARRETREIIAGHRRQLAALKRKWTVVPVRFVDLSEREAHLLALADNRLTEKAEWDEEGLQAILSGYSLGEVNVAGWSADDIDDMVKAFQGTDEAADDQSDDIQGDFAVLIECESENEQLHVLEVCEAQGFRCRALT